MKEVNLTEGSIFQKLIRFSICAFPGLSIAESQTEFNSETTLYDTAESFEYPQSGMVCSKCGKLSLW